MVFKRLPPHMFKRQDIEEKSVDELKVLIGEYGKIKKDAEAIANEYYWQIKKSLEELQDITGLSWKSLARRLGMNRYALDRMRSGTLADVDQARTIIRHLEHEKKALRAQSARSEEE